MENLKTLIGNYDIKECKKHGLTRYVEEASGYWRCTKCRNANVSNRRDKIKTLAIEYKGGKCFRCGYNKCERALAFHHLDPSKKDFGLSKNGLTRSWEKTKEELDKCVLVCHNCHAEIHDEEHIRSY